MLITCPSCAARYLVGDNVIGPSGRRVRCAACQHVWHQGAATEDGKRDLVRPASAPRVPVAPTSFYPNGSDGAGSAPASAEAPPAEAAAPADDSPRFQRAPQRPTSFDFDRTRARAAVMAQDISRATSRRTNPQRRGWYLSIGIVGILVPLIIYLQLDAIRTIIPAGWLRSSGDSSSGNAVNPELVAGLRIFYGQPTPVERDGKRTLPISGTITNPTASAVPLPRMVGRLLDAEGREVYSWSFSPPTESIRSGQTMAFDTQADKVPANAANLNIAFDTGQAR
jgi:predicted Zn finger-like uncharacterized protein